MFVYRVKNQGDTTQPGRELVGETGVSPRMLFSFTRWGLTVHQPENIYQLSSSFP